MNKSIKTILGVCVLLICFFGTYGQPVKPTVFALNEAALATNKNKIKANNAAIMPAYELLLKDAGKALQFGPVSVMEKKNAPPSGDMHDYMSLAPYFWPDPTKPDGLPYIRKDGQTTPEVKEYKDKEYLPKLCESLHTLALAYYFSGEQKYADHATKLIRVWFLDKATRMNPNLNFGQAIKGVNTGRGAGLIDSRHFIKVVDAVGLIQGSKAWTTTDQKALQAWFTEFLNWMQTSKIGTDEMGAANNHGAWYDAQRLSLALFVDSMKLAEKIVRNAQERLDKQMDNAGKLPLEMERTTSLHYSVFALQAFFNIARMAQKTGIDFWNYKSPSGKSLQKGFDEMYPYLAQQKKWEGQQIKEFETEEGLPILADGAEKFACKNCETDINKIAGEKATRLRMNLLYE